MHREKGIMPIPGERCITFRADEGEESVGEPLRDVTQLWACPRQSCRAVPYSQVSHPWFLFKWGLCDSTCTISLPHSRDFQKLVFLRLCPALAALLESAEAPPFVRRICPRFCRRLSQEGVQDAENY